MAINDIKRWTGFSPPQSAMLRLMLSNEGYTVTQWIERVGAFYGWHFHLEEQVHWVINGELEITVQEVGKTFRYTLKAGDRDVIKPNLYHTARVIGETELSYLVGVKQVIEAPIIITLDPKSKKVKTKTVKAKTTKPKAKSTIKKSKLKK